MPLSTQLTQRDRAVASRIARASLPPPRATYRLQLHKDFPLSAATTVVPYLARLGVTHVYASPIWASIPGSPHGYDVVDFGRIDEELGGREALDELSAALDAADLGLILDFVPNHMGISGGANPWWQDVLENGQASPYAPFFDIDWQPLKHELRDQVLVPVLGDQFGIVLERGDLRLEFDEGEFRIDYFGSSFPIAPLTYPALLRPALLAVQSRYDADDPALLELESVIAAFDRLPPNDETDRALLAERRREQLVNKRRLRELLAAEEPIRAAVDAVVGRMNGTPGEAASFDELEALLDAQSYRVAYWRVAAEEINYRRFFAINELAAIRQEEPAVFEETHRLLLELIGSGQVSGVRIDHPDGLWDPKGYVEQLQREAFLHRARWAIEGRRRGSVVEETWRLWLPELVGMRDQQLEKPGSDRLLYVVVEKILEKEEELPDDWPVAGTVGYEFARIVTGLFVDQGNRKALDDLYARFTGEATAFGNLVYEQKKRIMRVALVSEVNVLARSLDRLTERNRRTRDYTLNNLRDAMREVIACFPVYRTYGVCADGHLDARGRRYVDQAVDQALRRNPGSDPGVFEFIRRALLLGPADDATPDDRAETCRFVMKFQQLTGPVMAKGVEDTAFYGYNRLLALNEVGSDPAAFGTPVIDFHRDCEHRAQRWPTAMLTSSTHDTKRSEDVRARIDVLSELPREWRAAVNRWSRMNRRAKQRLRGEPAPDRNDEYHFYQNLVGMWPFGDDPQEASLSERMASYMIKVVREAGTHSSWISPNEEYEAAVTSFVTGLLDPRSRPDFLDDFRTFMEPVKRIGAFTSLSQQLLKLTAPGVPDIYQGTELWDFSLVDPDNRRPVDFGERAVLLEEMMARDPSPELAEALLADLSSGRIKLYLTARSLAHRAAHDGLFSRGAYIPLETSGRLAAHLVAFRRRLGAVETIVVVPRLVGGLLGTRVEAPVGDRWKDTVVHLSGARGGARFQNEFTGEEITAVSSEGTAILPVEDVLQSFPVALLRAIPDTPSNKARGKGIR